ncbi:hypothetical protein [Endozoicomonas arenosclerae]|nr:hypothetical protein [Endozoicomonas arenosclerae]
MSIDAAVESRLSAFACCDGAVVVKSQKMAGISGDDFKFMLH